MPDLHSIVRFAVWIQFHVHGCEPASAIAGRVIRTGFIVCHQQKSGQIVLLVSLANFIRSRTLIIPSFFKAW